jgi:hypothetical protein
MVHLSIAVQLHALADRPLTPEFLLGSLAPDAIHMRASTNRADKDHVHLRISQASEPEALERIQVLMSQAVPKKNGTDPFVEGYAAHLLTDFLWVQAAVRPFAERLPPDTSHAERRAWYYRETDQVDFNLYHRVPWRQAVWDLLANASAPEFAPYLTAHEIHRWRQRTLDWFEKLKQEPGIVPQIITDQVVEDFIQDTAQRIQTFF